MKNCVALLLVAFGINTGFAQEDNRPNYTGENFSLEGALAMFKESSSLKQFERKINDKNNNVNNLDLNNDGDIDFINVDDIKDGDSHIIVLSTYLNETEKQDIATIAIEKTGDAEAVLQIEGDKDLYAENTIIEPTEEKEVIKDAKGGPNTPVVEVQSIIINVWLWPCVRFIYAPNYVIWVSPYHWHHRPIWWHPWHPFAYTVFYVRCAPHRMWYHPVPRGRAFGIRNKYTPMRHSSTLVVHNRKGTPMVRQNVRGTTIKNVRPRNINGVRNAVKTPTVRGGNINGAVRGAKTRGGGGGRR
ncbi:hypothetical protein [Flavobacterium sp. XGLA_31]|uniref:hypothetical protein n=1 Tax=Flavobacterium sp. XGLA_31 TaxID=3447666 RepID=UPI003F32AADC